MDFEDGFIVALATPVLPFTRPAPEGPRVRGVGRADLGGSRPGAARTAIARGRHLLLSKHALR